MLKVVKQTNIYFLKIIFKKYERNCKIEMVLIKQYSSIYRQATKQTSILKPFKSLSAVQKFTNRSEVYQPSSNGIPQQSPL